MRKVKIKRLYEDVKLPKYETAGAAGFDLPVYFEKDKDVPVELGVGQWALFKTGLAFELPEGFELQLRPRSGLALKCGITVLNAPATIDSDYRGEVGIILINLGNKPFYVNHGDRVAQGVIKEAPQFKFIEVTELNKTERGTGGYGSTGGSKSLNTEERTVNR